MNRGAFPIFAVLAVALLCEPAAGQFGVGSTASLQYLKRAYEYRSRHDWDKAIEVDTEAIQQGIQNASFFVDRAECYCEKKDWNNAIADYTRAIEQFPKDVEATNALLQGNSVFHEDRWIGNLENLYYGRCRTYQRKGDFTAAVENWSKFIRLHPQQAAGYIYRAGVYREGKQFDKALADLAQCIQIEPRKAAECHRMSANIYDACMKDCAKAAEEYTQCIRLEPKAIHYAVRAYFYKHLNQWDKAFEDLSHAIELEPNDASHYHDRAEAYQERAGTHHDANDWQRAIADRTRCIELEPTKSSSYVFRGYTYEAMNEFEKAMADFTKAIEIDPKDTSAVEARKRLSEKKGDTKFAVLDATKAIELEPIAYNYRQRARIYQQMGNWEKALEDYTQAIEVAKDGDRVRYYDDRAEALRTKAEASGAKEDWDRSLADYTQCIHLEPNKSHWYFMRGCAYEVKGDYEKAMADYNKAIAIDPKDTASMNARRHLSSDKGDTKQELTDLNRAIEVKPDVWNYRYRANYYKKMREWDKAIADYTEAKRVDPENADYDGLAEVYEKQGDWDKALAARSEAVNHKPGDWLPYRNRAYTYKRKGDLEKADADMARVFRLLTEAVDNHPRETHYRSFRASTYSLEGQHDKAIFDYSKVIEMDPDDADAYNHRAEEYLTIREFEKALADYTRSIEIYSRNRSKSCPYGRRGNLYEELGQWEEAVADYAEEIRQSPKSEYGYVCRINAYKARGEFEKADADCAEAIEQLAENVKLNPGEWRYYAARAQIYVLKGDLDQAIDAYCEIMRVGARDGLAMSAAFQLRQLCELKGDWDRALNCLSEDIRQYPDRSSGHLARGRVYFDNGEYDEAIADFTEAIRLEPTPWGHTALAEVYEKTRNWDKAIDEASEAIRIAASQPHGAAYRLRARIYRSKGDFAKADADMRQAVQVASDNIKENPNMLHYRYLRIGLYREQQKFDQALAECNRIVDLEPKSDQPLFYRGLVYLEKGDYEKALVDFDGASSAAARHANTQAEVRIGRAMALFLSGKGDMNKAQAEYRLALRYDILAEEPFARSVGVRSQLMYQKLVDELKKP